MQLIIPITVDFLPGNHQWAFTGHHSL